MVGNCIGVGTCATKDIGCVVSLYFPTEASNSVSLLPIGPWGPVV